MIEFLNLWAQGNAARPPAASNNFWVSLLPFLPILIFFYLFLIRPQQRQEKQRREMLSALKKNDRVMTAGGIIGTVSSIDSTGEKVVVRVDDDKGVKLTVGRSYISRILTSEKDSTTSKPAAGADELA
jgi:preprotein translocase subunit YajC